MRLTKAKKNCGLHIDEWSAQKRTMMRSKCEELSLFLPVLVDYCFVLERVNPSSHRYQSQKGRVSAAWDAVDTSTLQAVATRYRLQTLSAASASSVVGQ